MVTTKKTCIQLHVKTRNDLESLGKKKQTYDQLIQELIALKNNIDSLDGKTPNLHPTSESTSQ